MRTDHKNESAVPIDYVERVNRAIDHIVRNLGEPLRLEEVAAAAGFSPFHFHRVFKSILGETLNQFVKRLRLERALYLMSHAPNRSLTDVALDCGFSSSSDFSRSFKQCYGAAPSVFDLDTFRNSRREEFERVLSRQKRGHRFTTLPADENPDGPDEFEAQLRDLPARTVAYIRVLDPYREGVAQAACERLLAWAIERGLADGQWLGYMWEEPEIVALEDCRYDVALVVDEVVPAGEIGRFEFPPMRVAEVVLSGGIDLEVRAIDWLYKTWLPRSGFVPDDQPAFEAWIGRPFAHGNEHFTIACQLPVRPA
ncbi:MAG: AraC family transcriptional regulator [Vicinamibacterales bacterium]